MHTEYDPDDNFARAFHPEADVDEDAALEALVWQFLLLVNPGDDEGAFQQFSACRERIANGADPVPALSEAIDWKAGFHMQEDDATGLIEVMDELAARFNLRIDWGVEDAFDDEFLAEADVPALINIAFDRLREHHYTVWTWETGDGSHAGWIALQRDDEAVRTVASALGFHVRPGAM